MLNKLCRSLFIKNTILPVYLSTSVKRIRDNDDLQLSKQQMQQLLGRKLKQSQTTIKPNGQIVAKQQPKDITDQSLHYYGLMPLKNQNYPICLDPDFVPIQQTPNQNIYKQLQLTQKSSFDEYTLALNKFRTEVDLYGDQQPKQIIQNNSLQFKQLLHPQSEYLITARKNMMVNISLPGTIECEDPRNFMELRPIQQFRNTPLVPISESYMKKHQQMLQRYHRKQFVFEVSTQSIINWSLILAVCSVGGYLIYLIVKKQEERSVNYSRLKYQRTVGESSQIPVFKI